MNIKNVQQNSLTAKNPLQKQSGECWNIGILEC